MRGALLAVAALLPLGACPDPSMRLDRATPDYGPLTGGTRITLEGEHFPSDARVFVGDREAPLAAVSRDGTKLDVVIPPGDSAGPVKLVVLADSAVASARDAFRYTTPPAIHSISLDRVVPATDTIATLTGSGFADDGAGDVIVLVDGAPATDVVVTSDTTLSFVVPDGPLLVQPTVDVIDDRGTASLERAFRYVPTRNPGLLLFPTYSGELAQLYDLIDRKLYSIPRPTPLVYRYTSVYVDGRGEYWAIDRARRFGRIDMHTGQLVDPATLSTELPAMTRYGADVLAIDRYAIGTLDPAAGIYYRNFNTSIGCCGGYGIAADGDTLYVTSRGNGVPILRTFEVTTGLFSAAITLQGSTTFSPEELRVVDHVVYATSRDGTLCTIDPVTGIVTVLASIQRANAFDVLR